MIWLFIQYGLFELIQLLSDEAPWIKGTFGIQQLLRRAKELLPALEQASAGFVLKGDRVSLSFDKVFCLENALIKQVHNEAVSQGLAELLDEVQRQRRGVSISLVHKAAVHIQAVDLNLAGQQCCQQDIGV